MSLYGTAVVDFETRSLLDLKRVGAHRYAEDPSTEVLCLSYQLPGQDTRLWTPPNVFPADLVAFIDDGGTLCAHNVSFERAVWRHILLARMGVPMPHRWTDTMAVCAYRSLPQSLDDVGSILNLPHQKNPRGKFLLGKLCKPCKPTKKEPISKFVEDYTLLEELYDYCEDDADSEREIEEAIGQLPPQEQRVWVLDQTINERGVKLDIAFVKAAVAVVEQIEHDLTAELVTLTDLAVGSGSERDKMLAWLKSRGVFLPDLTADTVEHALHGDDVPADARRVLEIREQLSTASTKKLRKMLEWVSGDGRCRGMLQYHGAGTGRWAGRGPQPHNFPRGSIKDMDALAAAIRTAAKAGWRLLELLYGDAMGALSSSLRGVFVADEVKVLMVGDFSAVEARVTSWCAGEDWKLDAFRAIDRGEGYQGSDDIYCATAAKIVKHPVKKKDHPEDRQLGKICELAFGYQGGVGAWRGFDKSRPGEKNYRTDAEVDNYKVEWREAHPATRDLWYGLEEAAVAALDTGLRTCYRRVRFEIVEDKAARWLTMILPNDRRLWYYEPRLETVRTQSGSLRQQISYEGRDNKHGGVWRRIRTYGGMLTENAVQAISRDLMVEAMIRVEALGYPIVLTVHDEIVSEPAAGHGSLDEFKKAMTLMPPWAGGLPLTVEAWSGNRYRKG